MNQNFLRQSLLASAVAASLALPAIASADATLYGSFRLGMFKTDQSSAELADYASRIGLRGTVDLGLEQTQGIFHYEQGLSLNSGALGGGRYASIGATGPWGTLRGGKLDHPTYTYVGQVNEFAMSALPVHIDVGYVANGSNPARGFRADRRVSNTLAYTSPNLGGAEFMVAGVFAGEADGSVFGDTATITPEKDRTLDGYNLGGKYTVEGLTLAAAYGAVKARKDVVSGYEVDSNLWGASARYNIQNFRLAAKYEQSKDKIDNSKEKGYGLQGTYEVNGYGASLGFSSVKADNASREKATQIEVHHRMGNGVVALGYVDYNSAAVGTQTAGDRALWPLNRGNDTAYLTYRLQF